MSSKLYIVHMLTLSGEHWHYVAPLRRSATQFMEDRSKESECLIVDNEHDAHERRALSNRWTLVMWLETASDFYQGC